MRGQVIDGLYKGCTVFRSENNALCIQDPQTGIIPVTRNNSQSVTDISHNYPGFGAKTYMVRWKEDAVSVLQLFPDQTIPQTQPETPKPGKKSRLPLVLGIAVAALCVVLAAAWFAGVFHRHTWAEATCTAPRTCTHCGEREGKILPHTPGDWTVVKKALYGSWGTRQQNCADCGKELARQSYLPDAYSGNLYTCSSDEFVQRLNLWLQEAGLAWDTELTDREGEMLAIQILEGDTLQGVVCFVDKNYSTVMGDGPGRINASSVCIAFQKGSTVQEKKLLPVLVACCNNNLDLASAGELVTQIQTNRKFESDGVRYHWGTVDGLDYLFLGFDSVPESLNKLPDVPGSEQEESHTPGQSILYDSNGNLRDADSFAAVYRQEAGKLSQEYGYGKLQVDYLSNFENHTYGIHKEGTSQYTAMGFGLGEDLITKNGTFDQIYLICPTDKEDLQTAFAFHSSAMVCLVDPTLGDLTECAGFLDQMVEEMDQEGKTLKEINGITYYMTLRDDGYICLVISF